ncbi:hypothetical protein PAESOLCIP111_06177 [Paenibacillus solanacearum]|uniref:SLH domain-containing protein n=1 Tax=Paenibacillus solanacearum TaxID=2048548 RepID=A0A916K8V4_9BACL|nr:hypothetical protein PAESOLCIP111_06177 [Paenibacillus solanacearum]
MTWDQGTPEYDPRTPGTYSFKGQLTIPNGKHNKGEREATVNVIVGDPSHDAALAGLSASKGALQPVFAAQTKDYNVSVANDVTEISLTATLNDTKGSLTIGGNLAASGVPSPPIALQVGPNVIHVMATAEDGVIVNDYAITVTRAGSSNAELMGLTTSAGALTPVFDSGTTAYSQSVANSVYSLRVTASLNEPNATLTIGGVPAASGVPSAEIPLQVGPNLIAVEVTAQNGTSRGHYTLTVTRAASSNAELSSLATSAGQLTPAFARGTTAYAQTVANSVYSVSVTASVYEPNATIKIGGVPAANGVSSAAIPLQVGPNAIAVDVTAQDGTTGRYTITVTRALSGNAELSSLATSAGQLTPVFSRGTTAYTQTVANSVYSVSVTASVYEPNATMKIDGVPAANDVSSAAIPLQVGPNAIAVDVTAQDGTTGRYTITVTRALSGNAELSSLATSAGQLTPAFARGTTSYETVVASGTQTVTVTASVYDPTASLFINDAAVASGAASSEILLQDGLNPIRVKVLAQDGVTETRYTLYVTRLLDESSSESGAVSGGSVNTGAGTARTQDIIVDGVRQSSWAAFTAEQVNGKTVVTITLDEQKVLDQLANGMGQVISIPVTVEADTMIGQLTGQLVKQMADKEAVIEIGSERAIYTLPATRLDIRHIADSLEAGMNLQDITFSIRISEASQEKADLISNAAREKGLTMAALPIEFEIEAAYGNNKMVVTEFTSYVERAIGLPDNVDASQVTTGVVFTADGNLSPIPTRIDVRDGHKYAVLSSLTNSTYAAVQSSKAFADLSGHWSKNDVNEMASRLIVNGMSEDAFAPDHSVTRAEFAAMTVRALGLRSGVSTQRAYRDVAASDWFADSVSLASAFGLIGGYEDGTFRPNQSITRSEAAVILTRAADVAKLNKELPANKADGQLSGFNDAADIADWAKASVALLVNKGILQGDEQQHIAPQAAVTRAQAAVMLKRLLQQAGLID